LASVSFAVLGAALEAGRRIKEEGRPNTLLQKQKKPSSGL